MSGNEQIEYELKNRFYYIEIPYRENDCLWINKLGEIHPINTMSLDHIKASINLVKRDIDKCKAHYSKFSNGSEIIETLVPLAKLKILELESEFKIKSSL